MLYYYGDLDELMMETYQQAIERFCGMREDAVERLADARDRLRECTDAGVASGPDDAIPRLLFEYWPRSLRDPRAAALDSTLLSGRRTRAEVVGLLRGYARTVTGCSLAE